MNNVKTCEKKVTNRSMRSVFLPVVTAPRRLNSTFNFCTDHVPYPSILTELVMPTLLKRHFRCAVC